MGRTASFVFFMIAWVGSAVAQGRADSTWRDHDRAADSAAAHGRWSEYLYHARVLDSLLSGHPGIVVALARAHAQLGDSAAAFALLHDLASSGIVRNLAADSLLTPLRASTSFQAVLETMTRNREPRGQATTLFGLADSGFAAEDVAYDRKRDRYLVSSILRRGIYVPDASGQYSPFLSSTDAAPLWAVMAVGVDPDRDRLWVTTIANDRIAGLVKGDPPRASIIRVDLATGKVARRFDLSRDGTPNEPGDMLVLPDGDVVISDGRTGAVYQIRRAVDTLETLAPTGTFFGPQQPALARGGRAVLIPDYVLGLALLDRTTAQTRWLRHSHRIVVNGIDGLVATGPTTFIAVQNGVVPRRIVRLTLDQELETIVRAEVLHQGNQTTDPTHGTVVGSDYVFIARGGGDALGRDGALPAGAKILPPVIVRIRK